MNRDSKNRSRPCISSKGKSQVSSVRVRYIYPLRFVLSDITAHINTGIRNLHLQPWFMKKDITLNLTFPG